MTNTQVMAAGSFGFSKVHQNNPIGVKGWDDDDTVLCFFLSLRVGLLNGSTRVFFQAGLS